MENWWAAVNPRLVVRVLCSGCTFRNVVDLSFRWFLVKAIRLKKWGCLTTTELNSLLMGNITSGSRRFLYCPMEGPGISGCCATRNTHRSSVQTNRCQQRPACSKRSVELWVPEPRTSHSKPYPE